jgi:hypothetical protein
MPVLADDEVKLKKGDTGGDDGGRGLLDASTVLARNTDP